MKRIMVVGLAILAVSTTSALAAKKSKAPAAAAATASPMMMPMMGQPSAKDLEMYKKNQADSGMAKKKK